MLVKYTYQSREFHQMNDNDGSYSTVPLLGAGATLGLAPVAATVCFGGDIQFCEYADTDRTCLLYTSPSPRDATLSRMPSSA